MRLPRSALLVLCILAAPPGLGGALAQQTPENKYDLKPLVPPVFTLPPNSQVKPGGVNRDSLSNDPAPPVGNFEPPPNPGIKFSVPTR